MEPSSLASHFRALRQVSLTRHTPPRNWPITMYIYVCVICLFTRLVSVIPYPAHRARVLRFLGA